LYHSESYIALSECSVSFLLFFKYLFLLIQRIQKSKLVLEELRTLVYCSSGEPAYFRTRCKGDYQSPTIAQSVFPNTPSSFVWSGSPNAYGSKYAWDVYFDNGSDYNSIRDLNEHVRLVRGGQ